MEMQEIINDIKKASPLFDDVKMFHHHFQMRVVVTVVLVPPFNTKVLECSTPSDPFITIGTTIGALNQWAKSSLSYTKHVLLERARELVFSHLEEQESKGGSETKGFLINSKPAPQSPLSMAVKSFVHSYYLDFAVPINPYIKVDPVPGLVAKIEAAQEQTKIPKILKPKPHTVHDLPHLFPVLRKEGIKCPVKECERNAYQQHAVLADLWNVIIHLNDEHNWRREDVADWLETLDVNLEIKVQK